MTSIAIIARRLAITQRVAARELEVALARAAMHAQLVAAGLDRSRKNHRLIARTPEGLPARLPVPRRWPIRAGEDPGDSPAAWVAPARSRTRPASRFTTKDPSMRMQVTATPEALVGELEATPVDESIAALVGEATAAIAAIADAARATMFPTTIPWFTADDAARYTALTSRLTAPRYPEHLAALAARARRSGMEALEAMFRTPECLADVDAAAESVAHPLNERESIGEARARHAAAARRRYEQLLCEQLADDPGDLGKAARQLQAAEQLAARVAAVEVKHAAHAAQVAEQAERARRAEEDAAIAADDAQEVKRLLVAMLRSHGLPVKLADEGGTFVNEHRGRLEVLVPLQRRLASTRVDGVRVSLGQGLGLYGTRDLSRSIGDLSVAQLQHIRNALDTAEGMVS